MRKYIILMTCFCYFACTNGLSREKKSIENPLFLQFTLQEMGKDSLKFFASQENFGLIDTSKLKRLSDTLLMRYLIPAQIENLNFTGGGQYWAGSRIAIDDSTIACVVYTADNWFKKISFLMYCPQKDSFYQSLPIAEFYGGESGLVYRIAWLYTHNKQNYLFHRAIEIAFGVMENENSEPVEKKFETNTLEKWEKGKFVATPLPDSLNFCQQFKHISPE